MANKRGEGIYGSLTCGCAKYEKFWGKGMTCVATTDYNTLDDEELIEALNKGPNSSVCSIQPLPPRSFHQLHTPIF